MILATLLEYNTSGQILEESKLCLIENIEKTNRMDHPGIRKGLKEFRQLLSGEKEETITGTMPCPNCSKPIVHDGGTPTVECPHCGALAARG